MHAWLKAILGGTKTTSLGVTTFTLGNDLEEFDLLIDKVNGKFQYSKCYVNRAIISGKSGRGTAPGLIEVALENVGQLETEVGSIPTISLPTTSDYTIYTFDSDTTLTLTIDAAPFEVEMKWFQLYIDNQIYRRWVNSPTATSFCPQDRIISLQVGSPFTSDNSAIRDNLLAGVPAELKFQIDADHYTKFTFPNLKAHIPTPTVQGKQEIDMPMPLVAYTLAGAAELVVTNKKG